MRNHSLRKKKLLMANLTAHLFLPCSRMLVAKAKGRERPTAPGLSQLCTPPTEWDLAEVLAKDRSVGSAVVAWVKFQGVAVFPRKRDTGRRQSTCPPPPRSNTVHFTHTIYNTQTTDTTHTTPTTRILNPGHTQRIRTQTHNIHTAQTTHTTYTIHNTHHRHNTLPV